jgi:hypothetical protein
MVSFLALKRGISCKNLNLGKSVYEGENSFNLTQIFMFWKELCCYLSRKKQELAMMLMLLMRREGSNPDIHNNS